MELERFITDIINQICLAVPVQTHVTIEANLKYSRDEKGRDHLEIMPYVYSNVDTTTHKVTIKFLIMGKPIEKDNSEGLK